MDNQRNIRKILQRLGRVEIKASGIGGGGIVPGGAFTPTYLGATTAGVTTYTTQVGAYIRTGKLVVATGRVTWTAATGTGVAVIGGLPLTSRNTTNLRYPVTLWVSAVTFGGSFVEGLLAENATAFTLYTTTSNVAATQLNVEAAGDIAFRVTYFL